MKNNVINKKTILKILLICMFIFIIISLNATNVFAEQEFNANIQDNDIKQLNKILSIIYMIMSTSCGLGLLSSVAAFCKCAIQLARSESGKSRSDAYQNILKCVIYTACLSSAPALYTLFLAIFI